MFGSNVSAGSIGRYRGRAYCSSFWHWHFASRYSLPSTGIPIRRAIRFTMYSLISLAVFCSSTGWHPIPAGSERSNHEIARWPTLRDEFPLPAERGEGQGEGCQGNTRSFSGNVFKAFPSPRPSPRSFLAGRGRRRIAACSPCLCRLSCGLLCKPRDNPKRQTRMARAKMLLLAVVGTLTLTSLPAVASDNPEEAMQKPQEFKRRITTVVGAKYLLYLPKDYSPKSRQRWPLILFLHGAGERGTNLALVAVHGPPKLVKQKREFPFIIVSPQCPEGETWSNDVLLGLLDTVMKKYRVDTNRVYLT